MNLRAWNEANINEFRANGGRVGGQFEGAPLLLLHTIGAKSGLPRINPLAYLHDKERFVVFASYAGESIDPPWYFNLLANPDVSIEVGTQKIDVRAEVVAEPERSALYEKICRIMPGFIEYQKKTTRVIPVVALIPR